MFLTLLIAASVATSCVADINFLAVGDWGGSPVPPYTMPGQVQSVKGMDKVATALKAQFVVALGDNFYFEGVKNDMDPRFEKTFESVYSPDSLQVPWYVIAGNHDHKGNVSAQISHSLISKRWNFPAAYHSQHFESEDGVTLDVILIDTSNLASINDVPEGALGYFDPLPEKPRSYAESQWSWIEEQLKTSTADYVIMGGHYPVYSVCEHGNTQTLITNLKPLLLQYGAHYMAGHDHCMEHLVEPGAEVNYFLSGMGDTCCYKSSNKDKVPEGSLKWYRAIDNRDGATAGFTSFSLTKEAMTAVFHDQDGNAIYTAAPIAPRKKA